ncbi:hypothetical protein X797_011790 [Metarhizium robertsii]|uniref:Uncharacterized protein n=1 Tax=Metarhizium robertsii TaxID=568076 RepID=A0A014PHT2_9HYPO|nr:hypothetical protein X797_011790 [Metarhizium robertsii]
MTLDMTSPCLTTLLARRKTPLEAAHVLQDVTREYLPQDARAVITTSGGRPPFVHGHGKDIEHVPAAVVVKQTPQTASFKFNLNSTIICECYFVPFEDDITVANSGPGSLEYGRLFGGRLSHWRISHELEYIDIRILPKTYDLTFEAPTPTVNKSENSTTAPSGLKRKFDEFLGKTRTTAPNKRRRNTSDAFVSASSSQEYDSQQRPAKAPKAPSHGQPAEDCGSTAVVGSTQITLAYNRSEPPRPFRLTIRPRHSMPGQVTASTRKSSVGNKLPSESYSVSNVTSIPSLGRSTFTYRCEHQRRGGIVALRVPRDVMSKDAIPKLAAEWKALSDDVLSRLRSVRPAPHSHGALPGYIHKARLPQAARRDRPVQRTVKAQKEAVSAGRFFFFFF